VNHLVLSMTTSAVPLRTRSACHQGPKSANSPCCSEVCGASNLYNLDSYGILLTNRAFFHIVNKRTAGALERTAACAFLDPNKTVSKPAHLSVERTPKRSRVPTAEAASLSRGRAEVGPEREEGPTGVLRLCSCRLPCAPSRDIKIHRHPLSHGDRRSVTRLSSHAFDMPGGWGHQATANDNPENPVVHRTADHSLPDRTAGLHQHSADPADADDSQDAARCLARDHSRKNRKQTR